MTKRYEFTGRTRDYCGRVLHEVRALVAISTALGLVNVGDVGGWVESEANLPQSGKAWVYPEATVCGDRTVLHGGTFRGGTFWDGTFEGGTFRGGTFEGGTFWGGTFRGGTFRGGTFRGGTFRGGTFRTEDSVATQPIFIAGFEYGITITDRHIGIGCQHHTIEDWAARGAEIAKRNSLEKFYREAEPAVRAICIATGRLPAPTEA